MSWSVPLVAFGALTRASTNASVVRTVRHHVEQLASPADGVHEVASTLAIGSLDYVLPKAVVLCRVGAYWAAVHVPGYRKIVVGGVIG